jgi:hypothetical protein
MSMLGMLMFEGSIVCWIRRLLFSERDVRLPVMILGGSLVARSSSPGNGLMAVMAVMAVVMPCLPVGFTGVAALKSVGGLVSC